jgi:hypothetical protein
MQIEDLLKDLSGRPLPTGTGPYRGMAGTGTLGQAARQAGDQVLYPVSAGYSTIATLTMIDRLYGPTKHLGNRGGCQNLSYPGSNAGWLSDLLSMPVSGQLLAGHQD